MSIDKKIIRLRYRIIIVNLIFSIILLLLIYSNNSFREYKQMLAFSIWLTISYGVLLWSELRCNGFNLLIFYLIGCFMRLIYPTYKTSLLAINGEPIFYMRPYNDISDVIYPTSVAMNISYMILLLSYTYYSKNKLPILNLSKLFYKFNIFYMSLFLYFLLIVFRLFPNVLSFSDTISHLALQLNKIILLILSFYCVYHKEKKSYILFIIIIIIECIYATLCGFYKRDILLPLLFYVLYYYLYAKNNHLRILSPRFVIIVTSVYSFLILFIYPFMTTKRIESEYNPLLGGATKEYSNIKIMENILSGKIDNSSNDYSEEAIDRQGAIAPNAFFYKKTNEFGYNKELLKKSIRLLVPKIIDSHKPLNDIGIMATSVVLTGNSNNASLFTTYTYIGFFGSSYFAGGWFYVISLTLLFGYVLAKIIRLCMKHITNVISLFLIIMIIIASLSSFEEICDGNISVIVNYCIFAIFIKISEKLLYLYWHRK